MRWCLQCIQHSILNWFQMLHQYAQSVSTHHVILSWFILSWFMMLHQYAQSASTQHVILN